MGVHIPKCNCILNALIIIKKEWSWSSAWILIKWACCPLNSRQHRSIAALIQWSTLAKWMNKGRIHGKKTENHDDRSRAWWWPLETLQGPRWEGSCQTLTPMVGPFFLTPPPLWLSPPPHWARPSSDWPPPVQTTGVCSLRHSPSQAFRVPPQWEIMRVRAFMLCMSSLLVQELSVPVPVRLISKNIVVTFLNLFFHYHTSTIN